MVKSARFLILSGLLVLGCATSAQASPEELRNANVQLQGALIYVSQNWPGSDISDDDRRVLSDAVDEILHLHLPQLAESRPDLVARIQKLPAHISETAKEMRRMHTLYIRMRTQQAVNSRDFKGSRAAEGEALNRELAKQIDANRAESGVLIKNLANELRLLQNILHAAMPSTLEELFEKAIRRAQNPQNAARFEKEHSALQLLWLETAALPRENAILTAKAIALEVAALQKKNRQLRQEMRDLQTKKGFVRKVIEFFTGPKVTEDEFKAELAVRQLEQEVQGNQLHQEKLLRLLLVHTFKSTEMDRMKVVEAIQDRYDAATRSARRVTLLKWLLTVGFGAATYTLGKDMMPSEYDTQIYVGIGLSLGFLSDALYSSVLGSRAMGARALSRSEPNLGNRLTAELLQSPVMNAFFKTLRENEKTFPQGPICELVLDSRLKLTGK